MSDYYPAGGYPAPENAPTSSGRDWMAEARRAFEVGDSQRALYAAREALAYDGNNDEAWAIRSRCSFALDRFEDAEFEAKEALRLAPHLATNHDALAYAYEVQERYAEALREAEEAVRLDPTDPRNRATLGSIHLGRGKPRDAIPLFKQLAKEIPSQPLYRHFLAQSLDQTALLSGTLLPDGGRIITNAEQARTARRNAEEALALEFNDDELRRDLRRHIAAANRAEEKMWVPARNLRAYVAVAIVGVLIGFIGLGSGNVTGVLSGIVYLLITGVVVVVYVARHRKYVWEHDAKFAAQQIRQAR